MTEPATTTNPASTGPSAQAPASGIDVAALICAFLIAPVGMILGLVSRSNAKKAGVKASTLATLSIVLGAVFTALGVVSLVVSIVLFSFVVNGANKASQCVQLGSDAAALESFAATAGSYDPSATQSVKGIADRIVSDAPSTQLRIVADGLAHDAANLLSSEGQGVLMDDTTWSSAQALADNIHQFCSAG